MKFYLALTCFIIALLFSIFFWGTNFGENKKIIEDQHQQIEIKNEIIQTKNEIFKRKEIAKSVSSSDNLEWLRQACCKDCSS